MAKLLKLRRGTTSQHSSFTGAEGEVTVDTDKESLVVHNGSNAGGYPLAREDMSNVSSASIAGRLATDSIAPAKIAAGTLPTDVTVASANIVDGTLVNADVNASAALALSKLEVITSNRIVGNDSGNAVPKELTAAEVRTIINVEDGATADQTAAEILTAVKTVDGNGSGLDADSVDGIEAYAFLRSDTNDTTSGELTFTTSGSYPIDINGSDDAKIVLRGSSNPYIRWREGNTDKAYIQWHSDGYFQLRNAEDGSGIRIKDDLRFSQNDFGTDYKIWHEGNMGAGSGLNADTVDSIQASSFVRSDADDSQSGVYAFTSTSDDVINFTGNATSDSRGIAFNNRAALTADYNDGYLRLNQGSEFGNGTYTPSLIRADGGFWVDGTSKGINGSGNFVGGTIAGASDYATLLRADTSDTMSGSLTLGGSLTVGNGATSSDIYMHDSDETTRRIHCNSSKVGFLKSDNNWGCYADNSGNWVAAGNVTAYSDQKLKTNVNTINDALSIVGKLRGVSFDWKADGEHSIGLIAQEVKEVLPELVVTNKGVSPVTQEIEEIKSVDYGKIVGVLINAINELKAEVDELKGGK